MTLLCIQGYFNFKINLQVLDNKNILFLKIWLQIKFAEYFFFLLGTENHFYFIGKYYFGTFQFVSDT